MAYCWCGSSPCAGPKQLLPGFVCRQAVEGGYTYHDPSLVPAPSAATCKDGLQVPSAVQELEALKAWIDKAEVQVDFPNGLHDYAVNALALQGVIDARLSRLAHQEGE